MPHPIRAEASVIRVAAELANDGIEANVIGAALLRQAAMMALADGLDLPTFMDLCEQTYKRTLAAMKAMPQA